MRWWCAAELRTRAAAGLWVRQCTTTQEPGRACAKPEAADCANMPNPQTTSATSDDHLQNTATLFPVDERAGTGEYQTGISDNAMPGGDPRHAGQHETARWTSRVETRVQEGCVCTVGQHLRTIPVTRVAATPLVCKKRGRPRALQTMNNPPTRIEPL